MAYSEVKIPRFYVNVLEWISATNVGAIAPIFFTNVDVKDYDTSGFDGDADEATYDAGIPLNSILGNKAFFAYLGHNFTTSGASVRHQETLAGGYHSALQEVPIVNAEFWHVGGSYNMYAEYDGFSIHYANFTGLDDDKFTLRWDRYSGTNNVDGYNAQIKLGSIVIGNYYDMTNAPNLSLTMSRDYGGTKEFTTYSGSSMSNTMHTGSPKWGDLGAWELLYPPAASQTNQNLARSGRRSWRLKFSYMSDSDLWGSNQMTSIYSPNVDTVNIALGYDEDDVRDVSWEEAESQQPWWASSAGFNYNLLTDDNFFSQVWQKTLGGTLPFIFQPDKDNNNPDQFAICKFKQNSLKATQSAHNVYDISLDIEEVW